MLAVFRPASISELLLVISLYTLTASTSASNVFSGSVLPSPVHTMEQPQMTTTTKPSPSFPPSLQPFANTNATQSNANGNSSSRAGPQTPTGSTLGTPPLEIFAFKFFDSVTGESVAFQGVDYYPRPNVGPLNVRNADLYTLDYAHIWQRDIEQFQKLGINAIRIYAVDPSLHHDEFMCALQQAGIYVMVALGASCANCSITREAAPACYPASLKQRGQFIINTFSRYDNVLAFDAGNEVGLGLPSTVAVNGPCQKKFVRDMREYIDSCSRTSASKMRRIPVGLVIADVDRQLNAAYYNCQANASDPFEYTEYLGLNAYQYCTPDVTNVTEASGLQGIRRQMANYSIPLLLTEYGCMNEGFPTIDGFAAQRTFIQASWFYQSEFRDILAGAFAFEYSVEANRIKNQISYPFDQFHPLNFGIGYLSPANCDDVDINCTYIPKPEFSNLAKNYRQVPSRGVVHIDQWRPPAERLGRSKCPSNVPGVYDFAWESDDPNSGVKNLECPQTWWTGYVCPFLQTQSPSLVPSPFPSSTPSLNPTWAPTGTASDTPSPGPTPVLSRTPTAIPSEQAHSRQPNMAPNQSPPSPPNASKPSATARPPTARPSSMGLKGTPPLEIEAYHFFDSISGESVALKGVAYNPRPNQGALDLNNFDFFHDEYSMIWQRDLERFKQLGINSIRLYSVDPSKNHDAFMCALQEAGIYVLIDLASSCVNCAVTSAAAPDCYPALLRQRGEYIISVFAKYDNVLGFIAGTDSSMDLSSVIDFAPCLKKFVRDMRAYTQSCRGMRHIPIGVALADVERTIKANYYNCQTDAKDQFDHADWLGVNAYQSCDPSVVQASKAEGLQQLKSDFSNYSIPLLLTEYGCLNKGFPKEDGFESQRNFLDAKWIFESEYRDEIAGGFAFEYSTEKANAGVSFPFKQFSASNYGVGYFSPENCTDQGIPCLYQPKPEFDNLARSYLNVTVRGIASRASFVPARNRVKRSTCPDSIPGIESFDWVSDSSANSAMFGNCPSASSLAFVCPFHARAVPSAAPSRRVGMPVESQSTSSAGAPLLSISSRIIGSAAVTLCLIFLSLGELK